MNPTMRMVIRAAFYSWFALGISFWFFVAFPFGNRNESYLWLEPLESKSFLDILGGDLPPYGQPRPLAHGVAWILYRLAGHSIWGVQLFNYLGAAAAWIMISLGIREKGTFALAALAVGGCLFPGYIYLFNLHGVFYSPVLILIAVLLAARRDIWTGNRPAALALAAVAAGLFHSYALLLYGAFLLGALFEDRKSLGHLRFAVGLGLAFIAFGLARILSLDPDATPIFSMISLKALFASYRAAEANIMLSAMSAALSIATAASLPMPTVGRTLIMAAGAAASAAAWATGLPVVFVWLLICLVKCLLLRRWSLALLLIFAGIFPLVRNSGSPTYAVFALMICAAVLPIGWTGAERRLGFLDGRMALAAAGCAAVLIACLRMGLPVPILSRPARAILAEKEKTRQLEQMVDWILHSRYSDYAVVLNSPAQRTMDDLKSALNRERRAPTHNKYLEPYLQWRRGTAGDSSKRLVLCFGNDTQRGSPTLYSTEGRYAGRAAICLVKRGGTER